METSFDIRLHRRRALAALAAGTGLLIGGGRLAVASPAAQTQSLESGALGLTRSEIEAQ